MQQKAVVLAVASLVSGIAFAQSNIYAGDNQTIWVDWNDDGVGEFRVFDRNGSDTPLNGIYSIQSDAKSTTIATDGQTALIVDNAGVAITRTAMTGVPVTGTLDVIVPGSADATTETQYTVTNTSSTTSSAPAPNSGVQVDTEGNVTLYKSAVNTAVQRFDTATKKIVNTDNTSPDFNTVISTETVYGIYTPAAGGSPATFVEFDDPASTGGSLIEGQGQTTTEGDRSGGSLTVQGATVTHGITNTGSIGTDALTDGTVKLENGELLNQAGHGLKITENGTVLSGGQSGEAPTSGVLTLNDGDAPGGTHLTIAGTAQAGPAATVLEVTSAADGSNVKTTLGTNAAGSKTVVQGSTNSIIGSTSTTIGTGSLDGVVTGNRVIVDASSARLTSANGGNSVAVNNLDGTVINGALTANHNATVKGDFAATSNAYLGGATPTLTITSNAMTVENGATVDMGGNRVHNVANGNATYDAVNYGQLMDVRKEARRGIANASALAGLPALEAGKQYNFGVGVGHYKGENALSLGGHARINADTTAKFGVGFTGSDAAVSAGVGWSF
jgi:trimeric autotransporter adhesin